MKWSCKVGRLLGIEVRLHVTFLLLLVLLGGVTWRSSGSPGAALQTVAFAGALFGCVLLHELGHALTARRFGIGTSEILLLPIGGLARLERLPEQPRQELAVALAGPGVNVLLAILLAGWVAVTRGPEALAGLSASVGPAAERLLALNLLLAAFNLLPAFPMDGGRVLRALLATRLGRRRATAIAATIGQGLAVAFAVLGLFGNPFLLFIGAVVFIGARAEAEWVEKQASLAGLLVGDAMITRFQTLAGHETLSRAAEMLLAGSQQDFPVSIGDSSVGLLRREDLLRALEEHRRDCPVSVVMQRVGGAAAETAPLGRTVDEMNARRQAVLLVSDGERVTGLLSLEHVRAMVQIQEALERRGAAAVRKANGAAAAIRRPAH